MGVMSTMSKPALYLLQFAATLMIIIGGMVVVYDLVSGEHNIAGWIAVLLGFLFLIVGSKHSVEE